MANDDVLTVGIIGHTGAGGYGHQIHLAWNGRNDARVVAVADPDAKGRAAAAAASGALRQYGDYREMLDRERPNGVAVCPRRLEHHEAMVLAAIESGARGIYCEKPFTRTPAEADRVVRAAETSGTRVQVALHRRADPHVGRAIELIRDGSVGRLHAMHGTGKNGRRGGAEDMVVLGVHIFDLMRAIAGDPAWVAARVLQQGHPIRPPDVHEGGERIGPVAGDQIHATFAFDHAVTGTFSSIRSPENSQRAIGLELVGTEGIISLRGAGAVSTRRLHMTTEAAGDPAEVSPWRRIVVPGADLGTANGPRDDTEGWRLSHARMIDDLHDAIRDERDPMCSAIDGRWTIEMVMGVHQAGLSGERVEFPLAQRDNPYASLR